MNSFISLHAMSFGSVIDKVFPFDKALEAFEHLKTQAHVGKVAIQVV